MYRNVRIVPAILANDAATLEKLVRQTETFTDYAQLDFMDGRFVPSHSFTVNDTTTLKTKLHWEAHLMMLQPEDYLATLQKAGAEKIVFHIEAVSSPTKMISLVKELGLKVGLAINPETPIAAFKKLVPEVDSVLFLAVNPGFYGAEFKPEILGKIKEFRKIFFKSEVGIDGGIKEHNIADAAGAGVDVIFVGSAIFHRPDAGEAFRKLTATAQAALKP
jgi:ribulose-phosphate 3-epimerase